MFFAMATTFHSFSIRILLRDAFRILAATAMVMAAGAAAGLIPIQLGFPERVAALVKLGEIGVGCLLMAWPALVITNSISTAERHSLMDAVMAKRRGILQVNHQ